MFGIYLILNGVERFLVELIRVNTKYTVAGISFTQAEMISLILVIAGIALIVNGYRNKKAKVSHG
jgi:prolipoprotein diacylglyceryltransferase